jgi:hypothetical protein
MQNTVGVNAPKIESHAALFGDLEVYDAQGKKLG